MTLKSARIARIENLPQNEQDKLGKTKGFAIIEIRNSEPKEEIKLLGGDGIRGYFLSLGEFGDIDFNGNYVNGIYSAKRYRTKC